MATKYFIVKDNRSTGPFTIEQLREINPDDDTFVWYDGLDKWRKLSTLPRLKELLHTEIAPPIFVAQDFQSQIKNFDGQTELINRQPDAEPQTSRPNNFLAEALLSIIFFPPTGIIAILKATKVDQLYDNGRYDEAYQKANEAKKWFIITVLLGLATLTYFML